MQKLLFVVGFCFMVIPAKDFIESLAVELANDVDINYKPSEFLVGISLKKKKNVKLTNKVCKKKRVKTKRVCPKTFPKSCSSNTHKKKLRRLK